MSGEWVRVVAASDCAACECCGEAVCPVHQEHYAECACPGPHQDDEFDYREVDGQLQARPIAQGDQQ